MDIVHPLGFDRDQTSKDMLLRILQDVKAIQYLIVAGVDVVALMEDAHSLFDDVQGEVLSMVELSEVIALDRCTSGATIRALSRIRQMVQSQSTSMKECLREVQKIGNWQQREGSESICSA